MNIETDDLAVLRETTSKTLLAVLWLHVPIAIAIGMARGEGWVMPARIMVAMALAATVSVAHERQWAFDPADLCRRLDGRLSVFVYQLAGHAWQIDMHMYFFAMLAGLTVLCDRLALIAAAGLIAVHHLALSVLAPDWVFGGGGDIPRVLLHAVIVVLQTGMLLWIVGQLSEFVNGKAEEAQRSLALVCKKTAVL